MPIPPGINGFQWSRHQASKLVKATSTLETFYTYWGSLTTAQKTALKLQAATVIDSVVAELGDIKTALNGL